MKDKINNPSFLLLVTIRIFIICLLFINFLRVKIYFKRAYYLHLICAFDVLHYFFVFVRGANKNKAGFHLFWKNFLCVFIALISVVHILLYYIIALMNLQKNFLHVSLSIIHILCY